MHLPRLVLSTLTVVIAGCTIAPVSLTSEQRSEIVTADEQRLTKLSYLGPNPILDVTDVIARAVVFNSDRELASLEARLAGLDSSQAYLDQLPTLTQRLSYSDRTNTSASTSADIIDGQVQALPDAPSFSTSSERDSRSSDLTLAFSVLDFGLAFGRAEQLADQLLIANEKERQAIQAVYRRAQATYWRAVAADRLSFELNALLLKTQEAYATSLEIQRRNLRDPLQSLTFQRELLDVERTLRDLKRDLATARSELDVLIGVRPGTRYVLRDAIDPRYPLPATLPDLASLEALALLNRSDIAENLYQRRILQSERDGLLLQLLPSLNLNASYNRDFSPYVLNDEWGGVGADLSWDFLNLFRVQPTRVRIELRERVLEEQRLQISLAALALVQQSYDLLGQNVERFDLALRYEQVTGDVFMQVSAAAQSQRSGSLAVLKEELNFLVARHRADLAYADLQASLSQMIEASGLNIVPSDWDSLSINELAAVIAQRRDAWHEANGANSLPTDSASLGSDVSSTQEVSPSQLAAATPGSASMDLGSGNQKSGADRQTTSGSGQVAYALQVCAFKNRETVVRLQQELASAGVTDLYIVKQGGFFKLRQGTFNSRIDVASAQQRLAQEHRFEGLVIRTRS